MNITQRQEQLSRAYVHAVASVAGCSISTPQVDDDSIDMQITSRIGGILYNSPQIDLQLKAPFKRNVFNLRSMSYPLSKKNYEDLRKKVLVPRILVVVVLADSEDDWIHHTEEELVIRHCAYWVSLKNEVDLADIKPSATIRLHKNQILDVAGLQTLMQIVADGGNP